MWHQPAPKRSGAASASPVKVSKHAVESGALRGTYIIRGTQGHVYNQGHSGARIESGALRGTYRIRGSQGHVYNQGLSGACI